MWWHRPGLEIVFDPNAVEAREGDVLVGLGSPLADFPGIVLNHKGALTPRSSITQYVMLATPETASGWRSRLPNGTSGIRRLVLEDLSLDTCFALQAFAISLDAQSRPHWLADEFADYVTTNELGGYSDSGPARNSLAILHTVLGHSYFERPETADKPEGEAPSPTLFAAGFRAAMNFLSSTLERTVLPRDPRYDQSSTEYLRALGHFDYEYQQYLKVLQHGLMVQLSIPVRDSRRRRIVDALIVDEMAPSGIVKTLARRDTEHSWTRNGFALLAVHRQHESLSGYFVTISVDPEAGLTLEDLWKDLEQLENSLWKNSRPRNDPRDLVSYRERDPAGNFVESKSAAGGSSWQLRPEAPNQPWYDDNGRYTLLGSPKAVIVEGHLVPGTRLSWREHILPAIWRAYSPIPLEISPADGPSLSGRHLQIVRWQKRADFSTVDSPTFNAWLAALSMSRPVKSPADLPDPDSFQEIPLPGGRLYLHREGVTLFDDWSSQPLDVQGYRRTIERVARASERYTNFLKKRPLEEAMSRLRQTVRKQKFKRDTLRVWRDQMIADKAELLAVETQSAGESETHEQTTVRQALERWWGLSELRSNVLELLDRLDQTMLTILAELKTRRDHGVASIAAGLGTGLLLAELAERLKDKLTMNPYEWQLKLNRNLVNEKVLTDTAAAVESWETVALAALIVGFMVGFLLMWFWGSKVATSE